MGTGSPTQGGTAAEAEVEHSPLSNDEVRNKDLYLLYSSMPSFLGQGQIYISLTYLSHKSCNNSMTYFK